MSRLKLLSLALCCCWAILPLSAQYAGTTAYVAQQGPVRLREAFQNNTATTIVLTGDYKISSELDDTQPIPITRNVTLTSSEGNSFLLDQNYVRGKLELCPTCILRVLNVTLVSDRRGKGILSFWSLNDMFFALGSGAKLVYQDTNMLRHGCSTSKDTRQIVLITKRSSAFPAAHTAGAEEAHEQELGQAHSAAEESEEQQFEIRNETVRGVMYPDSIHAIDYSIDAPLVVEDGVTTGGYAMHLLNSTRACQNTVATSCQLSPDACVNELVDAALEQERAAAAKGLITKAVAVPLVTVVVVAAVVVAVWALRRRRRRLLAAAGAAAQQGSHKSFSGCSAAAMEAGMLSSKDGFDSEGSAVVHRPFGLRRGWALVNSQVAPHIGSVEDPQIKFGELLGAGSFGRVYHGHWAGREVAIKVIQHTTETEEAVRQEVELMLAFNHPNIVRAYHYVSYIRDSMLAGASFTSKVSSPATSGGTRNGPQAPSPFTNGALPSGWNTLESTIASTASSEGGSASGTQLAAGCSTEAVVVPVARSTAPKKVETWLVEEFCDIGTLGSVAAAQWLPENEGDEQMLQRLLLLQDCARGLQALHDRQVVHGDLNGQNVLVSSNPVAQTGMTAKLADLGLSRIVLHYKTHHSTNSMGTLSHMPPELLKTGAMSQAVDVYSFGIMMWTLFTNQPAFRKLHYGQFYEAICVQNLRPLVPVNMPIDYQFLMERCWSSDPADRPPVSRILHSLCIMIDARTAACMERRQQKQGHQESMGPARALAASPATAETGPSSLSEKGSCHSSAAALAAASLLSALSTAQEGQEPSPADEPAATGRTSPAVEPAAAATAAAGVTADSRGLLGDDPINFSFGKKTEGVEPEPTPTLPRPAAMAAAAATAAAAPHTPASQASAAGAAKPSLPQLTPALQQQQQQQPASGLTADVSSVAQPATGAVASPFALVANRQPSAQSDDSEVQSPGTDGTWGRGDSLPHVHQRTWFV